MRPDPAVHAIDQLRKTLGFVPKRIAVQNRVRRYVEVMVPGPAPSLLGDIPLAITNPGGRIELVRVDRAEWWEGEDVRPQERISPAMGLWDDDGTTRGFWAFEHAFVVEVAPEVLSVHWAAENERQLEAENRRRELFRRARALLAGEDVP